MQKLKRHHDDQHVQRSADKCLRDEQSHDQSRMWLAREKLKPRRKATFGALMCELKASFDVDRGQGKRGRHAGHCPEREHDADAGSPIKTPAMSGPTSVPKPSSVSETPFAATSCCGVVASDGSNAATTGRQSVDTTACAAANAKIAASFRPK